MHVKFNSIDQLHTSLSVDSEADSEHLQHLCGSFSTG